MVARTAIDRVFGVSLPLSAYILVDLGFGDAGKGLLTDYLVRKTKAKVVIRYNGGAQAGHNVVAPDGRHHTFSQFGSGTFSSQVRTYLSRYVVIHPTALLVEGDVLIEKGVENPFLRLRISDQALVITPFHQAVNRIREIVRGADRHGSCGVGVGETVEDARNHSSDSIVADDLNSTAILKWKLHAIRERKRDQVLTLCKGIESEARIEHELEIFHRHDVIDSWMASISRIRELELVTPDDTLRQWLCESEDAIFEGAQGTLLDEDAGFHPYTTWSRSTTSNAYTILNDAAPDLPAHKIGVIRSYAVRHGPGPFPTETDELTPIISEHNRYNDWQGSVRYGWFDSVLTRYAIQATGGVDSLAVTHMDILPHLEKWKFCPGYKEYSGMSDTGADIFESNNLLTVFHPPQNFSLDERARLSRALSVVKPKFDICESNDKDVIQKIETLTGSPVRWVSRGPSEGYVQEWG